MWSALRIELSIVIIVCETNYIFEEELINDLGFIAATLSTFTFMPFWRFLLLKTHLLIFANLSFCLFWHKKIKHLPGR